jgi:hypothetical protein
LVAAKVDLPVHEGARGGCAVAPLVPAAPAAASDPPQPEALPPTAQQLLPPTNASPPTSLVLPDAAAAASAAAAAVVTVAATPSLAPAVSTEDKSFLPRESPSTGANAKTDVSAGGGAGGAGSLPPLPPPTAPSGGAAAGSAADATTQGTRDGVASVTAAPPLLPGPPLVARFSFLTKLLLVLIGDTDDDD